MIKKSKFLKNLLAGSEDKYDANAVGVAAGVTVRYGVGVVRAVTVRAG
jgi:hypothetical protein